MKFERIKLSTRSQQLLAGMKKKTGLTPNILARFAFCMSIKEKSIPNPDEFNQGGSELSPAVLFGEHEQMYHTLMINRLDNDKLDAEIRAIVGVKGADVVIETTGNSRVIEKAYELTNADGVTVCVGVPRKGDNISIYSLPLHFNKRFIGSQGGNAVPDIEIPRYISLMEAGKMTLDGLITDEFALDDINEALNLFRTGETGKILVKMTK